MLYLVKTKNVLLFLSATDPFHLPLHHHSRPHPSPRRHWRPLSSHPRMTLFHLPLSLSAVIRHQQQIDWSILKLFHWNLDEWKQPNPHCEIDKFEWIGIKLIGILVGMALIHLEWIDLNWSSFQKTKQKKKQKK